MTELSKADRGQWVREAQEGIPITNRARDRRILVLCKAVVDLRAALTAQEQESDRQAMRRADISLTVGSILKGLLPEGATFEDTAREVARLTAQVAELERERDERKTPENSEWVHINETGEWRCHCGYVSTSWDRFVAHFHAPPVAAAFPADEAVDENIENALVFLGSSGVRWFDGVRVYGELGRAEAQVARLTELVTKWRAVVATDPDYNTATVQAMCADELEAALTPPAPGQPETET